MDLNILITVICIGVSLLILLGVAVLIRRATVRALVWWVGLACVPIGALLAGMVPYALDAWNRFAEWWQKLMAGPIDTAPMAGLIVLGLGVAMMLISRVIPHRPRKKRDKSAPPAAPPGAGATAVRGRPIYDGSTSQPTN